MDPARLFKEIDENGDGTISWQEFMEFHERRPGPGGPEGRPMNRRFEGPGGPPPMREGGRGRQWNSTPGDDVREPGGPGRPRPEGPGRGPAGPPAPPVEPPR